MLLIKAEKSRGDSMDIALVFGDKGESIKKTLGGLKDDLVIDVYPSIDMLVRGSMTREKYYDRIILLSNILGNEDVAIATLSDYWKSCQQTSIILLCHESVTTQTKLKFVNSMVSSNVSALSVKSMTANTLLDLVCKPVHELNASYGVSYERDVKVDVEIVEIPKEEVQVVPEKKTGGFFSIFSKKKAIQEKPAIPEIQDISTSTEVTAEAVQVSVPNGTVENTVAIPSVAAQECTESVDLSTVIVSEDSVPDVHELENYEVNAEVPSPLVTEEPIPENTNSALELIAEPAEITTFKTEGIEHLVDDDESDDLSLFGAESLYRETLKVEPVEIIKEVPVEVIKEVVKEVVKEVQVEVPVEVIKEVPVEVIKEVPVEVVREVVREVESKSSSVVNSILSRKTKKIIIVTGDRGSGVTSLALSVAELFSKSVNVLYFDCDTDNHGLLSYIDYEEFLNFDDSQRKGVKLCKNVAAFNNCALSYNTNLDILTTGYDVEVSDEEIETAQSVVAEVCNRYDVVVADVPLSKLSLFQDLVIASTVLLTVEASKRGFMNTLCQLESSKLPVRYKRNVAGKGTIVLTKAADNFNVKALRKAVSAIVDVEDIDWLGMRSAVRPIDIKLDFLKKIID